MVRLWNPAMETPVTELRGHRNAVRAVATVRMPGGAPAIATGGDDRTIRLWDPRRHCEIGSPLTGHTAQVLSITRLSVRDGPALLATSSRDSSVRLWELTGATRTRSARNGAASATALAEIRTGQHGSVIAVGHADGSVRLLDIDTGEPARPPLAGNTVAVRAMSTLAISARLNLLAVAGSDRVVKIWNFAGGGGARPFKVITTGLGSVSALALISGDDGTTFLVAGGKDGAIEFWDLLRGRRIGYEPGAHKEHVLSLSAVRRPRGDLLVASGGRDHTIRFWNPASGTRGDLPPIDNRVPFSAMLPVPGHLGDPLLAVACRDDRVKIRVWNAVTGAMEGRSMSSPPIKATGAPPGGGGTVTALTTMHTDIGHDLLIAGNTNHTIGLWDLATGALLHRLDFGEEITACHASGERLIVASESGVTLLDLNRTPDRLAAYDARSAEYAGSADRHGRRDVEEPSEYRSRVKPALVAQSSSSRWRVVLAGVEPLRDEHLDIKFGIQRLEPDRAADARRWLRLAVTASPVGRRPEVTATARRLLRHLGQSAVALSVHARLAMGLPGLGNWERIERAQRLIHPICAEIADELRLRDSTPVPERESGGNGIADAGLEDLVLQVLGVLSLNRLHSAVSDLATSAYNAACQKVKPNAGPAMSWHNS
jgi:WD40 repeat protein